MLAELSAIESAGYLIGCPSLLIWDPEEGYKKFKTLSDYATQYNIPELNNFLEKAKELIALSKKACITPITKDVMITYANEGLLTDYMQHIVKTKHREARISGTMIDQNYNLLELLQQGDVANQYGAGLAAELLGNFKEAAERYGKAVRRSKDEMPEAASISYEGLARVAQKQNNLRAACEYAAKAVEINPNNLIALYDCSRYLALMGRSDKAIEKLVELITQDEKYLIGMNLDSEFQQLEVQRLYEELWDKQLVKNPIGLRQLLTNFLLFNDIDRAFSVFCFLVDSHPQSLFNPYLWLPQLFNKIEAPAKEYFRQLLSKGISSGNQRYAKTLLLLRLDFSSEDLLTAFLSELEDDPAYYEKDVEKIHRHLAANPPNEVEKLTEKILPLLREEYNWLKLEEYIHA